MIFSKRNKQITVQENIVAIMSVDGEDYICLTDMVKSKDGEFFVKDWLRNRNTLEFLAVWEAMHNPAFDMASVAEITSHSGLNSFKISVKEWIERTNAKGIVAKKGRNGGTYAHRDIAFEFGTWISPTFKLYLIKEYQRLKEIETNQYNVEWNVKRIVSKANYQIHTEAVKTWLVPVSTKWKKELEYAEEADILNVAIFGCTAKDWRLQTRHARNAKTSATWRASTSWWCCATSKA